ncbi:FecR family protein [Mucilaginibacter limnophilus]|uniref:FecR family protein n=1 Tax=Mucilaginibacter limnophilus TaxID=1932778 RepID=A0A3S2V1H3_9SPHI|nr:FecR family protein [Mucilaginibacter limnophilus]RVU00707.1 FecR family protein [Mucilaginibacter limnophilus]
MTKEKFLKIVDRIRDGSASHEDVRLYNAWFNNFTPNSEWDAEAGDAETIRNIMSRNINERIATRRVNHNITPLWIRLAAAASIVLCLIFGSFYILQKQEPDQPHYSNDVAPGHSKATLTLANGQKVLLTKGLYKQLTQGAASIQIDNGIIYSKGITDAAKITYNTLSTAAGEQSPYPLILPDGSKVWLNAKSSITFPIAFSGKQRTVKMRGEAMFEIVHDEKHPFIVQTDEQTIEDIGTIFNVNAYADETATRTTLVEGKVKVNNILLSPGQQSDGHSLKKVNVKRYTAWQNNDFHFENDAIESIMKELARWYNIEVKYEGDITTEKFTAQINRDKNLSSILQILENTKGVHFKVEGRRVTVTK